MAKMELLIQLGIGNSILAMAKELDKSVIYYDNDTSNVEWLSELTINTKKYAEYKGKYIKMKNTPEKRSWDIVIDHLEQCNE